MTLWTSRSALAFGAGAIAFAVACSPEKPGDGSTTSSLASCTESGDICTWAGTGDAAFNGDGRPLDESSLYWPIDALLDADGRSYIVDWNNHRVREVTEEGTLVTVVGGDFVGDGPEDQSDLSEPGAIGTEVLLNHPTQVVAMPDGKPIIVAWHNHKLRRYDPATGLVMVTCGRGAGFAGDGGPASAALLNQPNQMVVAEDGTQYILDQRNQVIRRIDTTGIIDTLAGTPNTPGFEGDGGAAAAAKFSFPTGSNPPPGGGLALDNAGNLYVADTLNHRIRKIELQTGVITSIAGTGEAGFSGDGGAALAAQLNGPRKLTIGPDARLYVGDEFNNRIRAIDLSTGNIETVAGTGIAEYSGDGGPAREAALNRPSGVSFDAEGNMYVIDTYNGRVRIVFR